MADFTTLDDASLIKMLNLHVSIVLGITPRTMKGAGGKQEATPEGMIQQTGFINLAVIWQAFPEVMRRGLPMSEFEIAACEEIMEIMKEG